MQVGIERKSEALVRRGDTVVMTGRSDTVHAAAQLADRVAQAQPWP